MIFDCGFIWWYMQQKNNDFCVGIRFDMYAKSDLRHCSMFSMISF